ncbi:MAG: M48 family metalloprotease [Desulforegulaceae bacterium]|nr:M48 family metalloprotease [Desulforegulaceae bacterium]
MRFYFSFVSVFLIIFSIFIIPDFSYSLSVKEEKVIGREVLNQIKRAYPVVTDPYIVKYINDIGQVVVDNSDNRLFDFSFHIIKNKEYNAFAVPGGYIFVHTGLIAAMEEECELVGILAHEAAHVTSRHIAQQVEDSKKISLGTLAGLAAGIALGMSGGDPDAVMGLIAGTQALGQSAMLSYSREHEREADKKGLIYLTKAGYSPEGLLEILKTMRSKEYFTEEHAPVYMRTHPGTKERIEYISSFIDNNKELVETCTRGEKGVFSRFNKVKIKITALYEEKNFALKRFEEMEKDPQKKPGAYYGLALLAMKNEEYEKSKYYFLKALKYNALDSELLFDYGKTLFYKGDFKSALQKFNTIKAHGVDFLEIEVFRGRAYLELENYERAKELFDILTLKHPEILYLWYYNAVANEKSGYSGLSHYYLGRYHELRNDNDLTVFHYKKAASLLDGKEKSEVDERLKAFLNRGKKKKKKSEKEDGEEKAQFRLIKKSIRLNSLPDGVFGNLII